MANTRKRQPASKRTAKRKPAQKGGTARERKPTRQERWDAAQRDKRRRRVLQRGAAALIAFVLIAGVVTWQIGNRRDASRAIAAMTRGTCKFDRKSDVGRVNEHAAEVAFGVEPPSGGVHEASAASPGVFRDGESPPDGQ
ncbi:MAG: hypothetical protein Q8K63_03435, partial [Acidimicrobiales bacterium]|nr:hypothetical protein [Acidimicrobiales bacterium]